MSAKIARGGGGSRSQPRGKASARGKGSRSAPAPALPDAFRRMSGWIFLLMLGAVVLAAMMALRVPQMIGGTLGETAGEAGFSVSRWEIRGLHRMDRKRIDDVVDGQLRQTRAEALIDLEGLRQQLLRFGWVKDARVSRRLPDGLVIDIVEREPRAVWQNRGMLMLIDPEGVVLDYVRLDAMPDLPLVIGPQANAHIAELGRLVASAPRLKPAMEGATWVGGRRWDLRFQSGEVLALPEGEGAAARALSYFDHRDQATQLLGRGFVRFDMRIPGKFIVRVSNEPGSTIPSIAPDAPPAAAQPAPPPPAPAGAQGDVDATKTI
ncbi:MAG: cell division protein FtsQ/DivIB [Alphaproteobacteria bacterium]|nr:cell division protein FtsQ/DivIB [Alphaproteobacteria bacterium]MBV9371635.1 cell division protein FtsQ/DivIB [Alphaproteobacteria bacterium]MBV9900352.1 cell division protein FtsQ/DivIB [Alphaproteobacteria bacterium]